MEKIVLQFVPDFGVCDFEKLKDRLLPCAAKKRLPEDAKSVILCVFPYRFPETADRTLSRYACVPDYHMAAGGVLKQLAAALKTAYPAYQFVPFIDNSPIPEVYAAALSGLGVIGKNSLLIHPTFGSYVFIGEIVTDMPLKTTGGEVKGCVNCGACIDACFGGCLPHKDRQNCVSAISQKKGTLTEEETALLKQSGLIWGCDRCQEVCPHNRDAATAPHPCFTEFTLCFVENDPLFSTRAYAWRGEAVIRRNIEILK